jgi:ubiquinol-cytochrome c reductase iron-sulfur subunit
MQFSQLVRHSHNTSIPEKLQSVRKGGDDFANRNYVYMGMGATGFTAAVMVREAVADFLDTMNASADVLALASVEVKLDDIAVGESVTIKWRGKPVFIRHRSEKEIAEARSVDVGSLRDQEKDEVRVQNPEWLVVLGICTHLGCVPLANAGAYKAYFCPCHGSHYDMSGRIRIGPAPLNLEVPEYKFLDATSIRIG